MEYVCEYCNKVFVKENKYHKYKFCNKKCSNASRKGIPSWNSGKTYEELYSPEQIAEIKSKQSMKGEENPMYGKKHSLSAKEKMSKAGKGKTSWIKGLTKDTHPWLAELSDRMKENNPNQRPEVRRKIAAARIREQQEKVGRGVQLTPFYNRNAIQVIEEYGRENGYSFQHAENGGEVFFSKVTAWADGYDESRNTVIEFYEKSHYDSLTQLNKKTLAREEMLIKEYGCKLIRVHAYHPSEISFEVL